jgi:transposase, IS30 family
MGRHYEHLTLEERCTIAQLHQAGQSIRKIAAALDRPPSSVSRELKRNSGSQVGYKPSYAQEQAAARRWTGSRLERDTELRSLVLDWLGRGWSPEQIAGRLKQQHARVTISHESIYRFIYAQIRRTNDGAWRNYLPRRKYRRGWQGRKHSVDDLIKGRVSIALRPHGVEARRTFGHWEGDLMASPLPARPLL